MTANQGHFLDRQTHKRVAKLKEPVENLTQKSPIQIVQERKLKSFGHVTRHPYKLRHDGQANMNTIMYGRIPGNRGRGRPRGGCMVDICRWTRSTPSQAPTLAESRELRIRRIRVGLSTDLEGAFGVKEIEMITQAVTHLRQWSCHNTLSKGFRLSRGRSSTPRRL